MTRHMLSLVTLLATAAWVPSFGTPVVEPPAPVPAQVATVEATAEPVVAKPLPREVGTPSDPVLPELATRAVRATFFGSLRPTFAMIQRDTPAARDRLTYGLGGSRVDLGLDAAAGAGVSALLYVRVASEDGEGRIELDRALVRYEPTRFLRFGVGRDKVPLSAQSATPTAARLFPTRIALDDTFVRPIDVGASASVVTDKVTTIAGVWNGAGGDAMLEPGATERGLIYAARVEVTPLGAFAFDETKTSDQLKLALGAGASYRAATAFTPAGNAGTRSRDLRATASVRVGWRGLYAQAEVLRRQITDDLSMRPDVATGGYVQASWQLSTHGVGIGPLFRAGVERVRQLSAPATGSSVEAGAMISPARRLQIVALFGRIAEPDTEVAQQLTTQIRVPF